MVTRVVTSASRALGNPDDPLGAFASSFLHDVLQDSGLASTGSTNEAANASRAAVAVSDAVETAPEPGDEHWVLVNTAADSSDRSAQAASNNSAHGVDHRNGADVESDAYNPASAANHRNGTDVDSDGSDPRGAYLPPRTAATDDSRSSSATAINPAPMQVTVTGTRLPTDAEGNQLDVRANGEALLWLHGGGVVSLGSISPELAAELSSSAVLLGSLPARLATGATSATLADGLALALRTGAAAVIDAMPELGLRAISTAGALLAFSGNIPGDNVVELGAGLRFFGPDGSTLGMVQEQQRDGSWQVVRDNASLVEVMGRYVALTPQELGRAQAPLITTTAPQTPSGAPPLPAWADRAEVIPGYLAQPATPTNTTTPGVTPHWQDLLLEQSNSDNNRDLAQQRYRDNPTLQDPAALAGRTVPGVGAWGYPGTPRGTSGADYAEQLAGVPAGLELNVGGAPNAQGVITGGAWLDGVEIRGGQATLIDRKDWAGYPPLGENFWHRKTVEEAIRQLDAAQQIGARVEWQFSTQAAADAVSGLLQARAELLDARLAEINIRAVPKE